MQLKKETITAKKNNYFIIALVALVVIAFVFLKVTEPENPVKEIKNVSKMWQTNTTLLMDESRVNEINSANISNQTKEEKQEELDNSNVPEEDIAQLERIDGNSQSASEKEASKGGSSPERNQEQSGQESGSEISPEGELAEEYFRTSIISGDVVEDKKYSFTLKHLKPELEPVGISINLNGKEKIYAPKDSRFEVKLAEGKNKIVVEVLYQSGEDTVTASKGYTIYYAPGGKVLIITNLTNRKTDQKEITFSAYGLKDKKHITARVKVNNKQIEGNGENFTVKLKPGKNKITITSGGRKDSVTETFTINCVDNIFKIVTTLSDTVIYGTEKQTRPEEVDYVSDKPSCKFKVHVNQVTGKEKLQRVSVYRYDGNNNTLLKKNADGCYTFDFTQRKSALVTLRYTDSKGKEHKYEYLVHFKRSGDSTPQEKYPKVKVNVEVGSNIMNLASGMKFKSPSIILNISAKSCNNEPLYFNHFTVVVNGHKFYQHNYQTGSEWFGYDVTLKEGENNISVTVRDDDQYSVTKNYKVYYTPGDVTIMVSVEATTVGLGYLVPPTKVTVPGGTNVAEIVVDLLKNNGYTCYGGGTTASGYYLSRISKPGLTNGYHIPEDLIEFIEADGGDIAMETGLNDPNVLGEFDFYRYSGWMYSYDGDYPGYSMSSCRPQDGSVIRVRFTLAHGKDIGGFIATGGSYEGEIQGNYGKEW